MKALVTGVAGFIGSHLAERLLAEGWEVTGIDNFDPFYDPNVKRSNIQTCLQDPRFRLMEGDIRDRAVVDLAMEGRPDIVVHLAAKAGVRPSIEHPLEYVDVNLNGTAILLDATCRYGIPRFIFASSSSVYGNNPKIPFSENDNVDRPISPYAATKRAGELLCHTFHYLHGISVTCLRFFTVYGPRQRPDLAIHKFARLILQDKPIPIYGDGTMQRDFTYIDDIIDGVMAAIQRCNGFRIYNLGNSHPVSVNNLIAYLEALMGRSANRQHLPPQPGDVDRTYADITKAANELGYSPKTPLEKGLRHFLTWLQANT
ncbi:MAG: GDP-mannose 4,6-dehydratase [Sedimentisphaerales bacterium]|nr:GDP-mannose 4,6-dehydratase [Sedimentisphaerales bacterium]